MEVGQQINFITIHKKASSLYTLVADGVFRNTSVGRDTWKALLISQGSLQRNCNQEGFNAFSGVGSNWNMDWSKVRIGILANSNNDLRAYFHQWKSEYNKWFDLHKNTV